MPLSRPTEIDVLCFIVVSSFCKIMSRLEWFVPEAIDIHVKYFAPLNSSRLGHVGKIIN